MIPTREEVIRKIKELAAESEGKKSPSDISDDMPLGDVQGGLGLLSLDTVELMQGIDEEYEAFIKGGRIDDDEYGKFAKSIGKEVKDLTAPNLAELVLTKMV